MAFLQHPVFLHRQAQNPPIPWWLGPNPETKAQEEIDMVCSSLDGKNILFAECKWRNGITDAAILRRLIEKSELFKGYENKYYYLFSKSSFSENCYELAKEVKNIRLIDLDMLFK